MDLRKLKTLIDLVAESDISELEVTEGEGKGTNRQKPAPVHHGHAAANDAASTSSHGCTRCRSSNACSHRGTGSGTSRCRPQSNFTHGGHVLPRTQPRRLQFR